MMEIPFNSRVLNARARFADRPLTFCGLVEWLAEQNIQRGFVASDDCHCLLAHYAAERAGLLPGTLSVACDFIRLDGHHVLEMPDWASAMIAKFDERFQDEGVAYVRQALAFCREFRASYDGELQ